jgi:hypothetical protein
LLLQFKPFLQDIGTVYRVMETLFKHLDQGSRWQQGRLVKRLMELVQRSCADQPFPLYTALLRHSSASELSSADRCTIIRLAQEQGSLYSLSEFSVALKELPKCISQQDVLPIAEPPLDQLRVVVYDAVLQLSRKVGDASQLCEAIGTSLRNHANDSGEARSCLDCALQAVRVLASLPDHTRLFGGQVLPASFLAALRAAITSWGPGSRTTALLILATTLPCCGDSLADETQALALLGIVHSLASSGKPGGPLDVACMDTAVRACSSPTCPDSLLSCVRLLMDLPLLHRQASVTAQAAPAAQWGCALLVLVNSMLSCLADVMKCPGLRALEFDVDFGLTGLNLTPTGLVASSWQFAAASSSEEAAACACLQSAAGICASTWPAGLVTAVCQVGDRYRQ